MRNVSGLRASSWVQQQTIRARCLHPSGVFVHFPPEEIEQSIGARFEQQVHRYPDRLALKTRTQALTYTEVNQTANQIAHALLAQYEHIQEPVALLFDNGAPFVIASLGVLKAGKIQVPLQSTFPHARLRYILEQSRAALLLTDTAHLPLAQELTTLPLINIDTMVDCYPATTPELSLSPEALVSVEYTSGSTGQPKGIARNHRGVLHAVMHHTNISRLCMHDRLVVFRPGLRVALYALLNGAAFCPVNLPEVEPRDIANWLIQEQITVYRAAVSTFRSFAGSLTGTEVFPDLRLMLLFGEATYPPEVELYQKHFAASCLLVSTLGCNEFGDYAHFFLDKTTPFPGGPIPGGYPVADTEILLLDSDGHPLAGEQVGEIALRSHYGAVGYWDRPDLTQKAFLQDATNTTARIYRTGDLGRIAADGCLFHAGRKDFQVKIRGHRVEIAEVETALLELEGVQETAVVSWQKSPGITSLVAYIVPAGPHRPQVQMLRRRLADQLPDYMVPALFVMLEALPHTPTGKVDRRALPPPDGMRPELDTPYVAPQTPVEVQLAAIWADVLGLDRVGVSDRFLELGGDSLLATRVVTRVFSQFQVQLPLHVLLEAATVAEMAMVIVQNQVGENVSQDIDRILAELESLTEDETRSRLDMS
jgi:amino acid adenylation domain-containing protein